MKKILIFGILLVFFFSFASAGIIIEEYTDFSGQLDFPNNSFVGQGLEVESLTYEGGETIIGIHFIQEGSILNVNGQIYENIKPEIEDPSFILFNDNLTCISADFYTNNIGGSYRLGNRTIDAPPNSKISFNGKEIAILIADGTNLSVYSNLFNFALGTPFTTIVGKDLYLPNEIYLKEGFIEVNSEGFLLTGGEINYKKNLLETDLDFDPILIANKGQDMSNYKGNWIRQEGDILEAQAGESFFRLDFEPGHEILNNDKLDKFYTAIGPGNYLKIEERSKNGLIPKLTHKSGEEKQFTYLANDNFGMNIQENGFNFNPKLIDHSIKFPFYDNPYQSIAMEIEFDSDKINQKIKINPYRQFVILSKDDEELVTFNKHNLPISNKLSDNYIQDLNQLRNKYPTMNFTINSTASYLKYEFDQYNTEDQIPPYLIYLTDLYLTQNPEALEDVKIIELFDSDTAYALADSKMGFGRTILETEGDSFTIIPIREITNPLKIIEHEHEHVKDGNMERKEFEYFRSLNDPTLDNDFKKIDEMEKEIIEINSKMMDIVEMKGAYAKLTIDEIENQVMELGTAREKLTSKINKYEKILLKNYYDNYENPTIQQEYNKLAKEGLRTYLGDDEVLEQIDEGIRQIEEQYLKKEVNNILRISGLKQISKDKEIDDYWDYISRNLFTIKGPYGYPPGTLFLRQELKDAGYVSGDFAELKNFTTIINDYKETRRTKLFGLIKVKEVEPEEGYSLLDKVSLATENIAEIQHINDRFDSILRESSGMPFHYSLKNYAKAYKEVSTASYLEVSTTYMEQPLEVKKQRLNSANPNIQSTYTKLTQLAFDGNKMSVEDYKYLMPESHCERPDCSDQLCVEYKLMCCIDHPESPNC
jgi:hypothetical protein